MLNFLMESDHNDEKSHLNTRNPIKYLARQYARLFLIPKSPYLEEPIPLTLANCMPNNHQEQVLNDLYATLKCCRCPFFIFIISAIQLFVFNYDLVQANEHKSNLSVGQVGLSYGPASKLLIFNPEKRHEFWRYLTYVFVHYGFFHLVGNLMAQIFLGLSLEIQYGLWRILLLYMASVMAAAGIVSYYNPTIYLAGASGGVYALYGAHIANLLNNWKQIYSPALQLVFFGVVGLIDLYGTIKNYNPATSYGCHAVGAIAGLIFGLALNKKVKRILLRLPIQFWKYFVAAVFVIVVIYITYQNYFHSAKLDTLLSVASPIATSLNSSSEYL